MPPLPPFLAPQKAPSLTIPGELQAALNEPVSLARQVIEIVAPQLRLGAMVLNDNSEADYLQWVRDPKSGFLSLSLPFRKSFELSVKVK